MKILLFFIFISFCFPTYADSKWNSLLRWFGLGKTIDIECSSFSKKNECYEIMDIAKGAGCKASYELMQAYYDQRTDVSRAEFHVNSSNCKIVKKDVPCSSGYEARNLSLEYKICLLTQNHPDNDSTSKKKDMLTTKSNHLKCSQALRDSNSDENMSEKQIIAIFQDLAEQFESYGTTTEGQIRRRDSVRSKVLSAREKCSGLSTKIDTEISLAVHTVNRTPAHIYKGNPKIKDTDAYGNE